MNKFFLKIGIGLLAVAGMVWPADADVNGMKTLPGHVPSVISHLGALGRVNATNRLHLAIGLPLRNQDQLKILLQQVSDPASPNYHHYLTTEEFTEQFGPTEDDAQAVVNFAQANGLIVKKVHANRMLIEAEGQATDVERAFSVKLHNYHLATENRDFYAPDQEPSVPSSLAVLDVQGLNSYVQPHPKSHIIKGKPSPAHLGSAGNGSYLGNDFRPAYVPGTTLTGAGQNVALFEWDGYLASDITAYEQISGITTSVVLTNILLQGFSGIPQFGGQDEVTLDIDMILAMAPGVSQIQVYEGNLAAGVDPNVILNQIATDNLAKQISCSWGWGGGPSTTTDQIFQQMILQGQSFFNAVGDSCAFPQPGQAGSVDDPSFPNAPSDSPYITQVGGTTLTTTGPGGSFVSETVWNWGIEFGTNADGIGSSGGISGYYTIPTWQTNINMSTNLGSTKVRNMPDVALTADNIDIVLDGVDLGSQGSFIGGTSAAAPLWAGFTALVNQQGKINGLGSVGFLNPALYTLAGTNSTAFRDVVTGNNTWSQSTNLYYAVPGYDLCTGWGSPDGTNLINLLATSAFAPVVPPTMEIPAPQQPWGNTLSVNNGSNPNGFWLLFMADDTLNNYSGTNFGGWILNLTTANPVGFSADNQLYISQTNVLVYYGMKWTNTLSVTNYGPAGSTNIYVTDELPLHSAISLVSSNSTLTNSLVEVVGSTLVWSVGSLSCGSGGSLCLVFTNLYPGIYTNSAAVTATTQDPNPDDDSVGVNIVVSPQMFVLTPKYVHGSHGALQLSMDSYPLGLTIVIQASTNLVNWVPVATGVSPFVFTNFDSTNFNSRFYRAVTSQ